MNRQRRVSFHFFIYKTESLAFKREENKYLSFRSLIPTCFNLTIQIDFSSNFRKRII